MAAGLDDGGAELLFHLAGRRFVLEKIRFARKGLCMEGMVRSVTKDTVRLWRHSRIMNPSGLSLDVRVPEGQVIAIVVLLGNLLVDLVYGLLDPRIRYD